MVTIIVTTTIAFLFDHARHKSSQRKTISKSVSLAAKPTSTPTITPISILKVTPTITPTIMKPSTISTGNTAVISPTPTVTPISSTQGYTAPQQDTANTQTQPVQDNKEGTTSNTANILASPLEILTNRPLSIHLGSL